MVRIRGIRAPPPRLDQFSSLPCPIILCAANTRHLIRSLVRIERRSCSSFGYSFHHNRNAVFVFLRGSCDLRNFKVNCCYPCPRDTFGGFLFLSSPSVSIFMTVSRRISSSGPAHGPFLLLLVRGRPRFAGLVSLSLCLCHHVLVR